MTNPPPQYHQHRSSFKNLMARSPTAAFLVLTGALVVVAGSVYALYIVMNKAGVPKGGPNAPQQSAQPTTNAASRDEGPTLVQAIKVLPAAQLTATAEAMVEALSRLEDSAETQPATQTPTAPATEPTSRPLPTLDPGYRGKVIDVTGRVYAKGDSELVGIYIALGGGVERTRGVHCTLAPENAGQVGSIQKGQTVLIRGRCVNLAKDIELEDCAVLKILSSE